MLRLIASCLIGIPFKIIFHRYIALVQASIDRNLFASILRLIIPKTEYHVCVKGDRVVILDPATNQQITQFRNSRANTQKRIAAGRWKPISSAVMFKAIDVWKRIDDTAAIRYRCFQRLTDEQFCVQSADYYYLPLNEKQVKTLDQQFLELFIEESPDQRSTLYSTIKEAIAQYDRDSADAMSSSGEPQVA